MSPKLPIDGAYSHKVEPRASRKLQTIITYLTGGIYSAQTWLSPSIVIRHYRVADAAYILVVVH